MGLECFDETEGSFAVGRRVSRGTEEQALKLESLVQAPVVYLSSQFRDDPSKKKILKLYGS